MSFVGSIFDRVTGRHGLKKAIVRSEQLVKRYHNALSGNIDAASRGRASPGWTGFGSNRDEDAANKEYLRSLADVLQRSQDLDVNNPDLRGFHRSRTAQIVGAHVRFKATPKAEEVNVDAKKLTGITSQIDRVRSLHSSSGGLDSTGNGRSEGELQEKSTLTKMIHGSCLIHRVWRPENPILPISIELIPGVRISTPHERMGDPKISYGVEYADTLRTRVVAYHVRRVSETRGDSFVPSYIWDRLPIEDCSLDALVEPAGMDRSMPLSVACIRMLRNRGEFMESAVSSARAQSRIYAATQVAKGASPYEVALDDADQQNTTSEGKPSNFSTLGDVVMLYLNNGETISWNAAKLPDPDLKGFMDVTDVRMARGLTSSKSRFTREVLGSWAGGRLEDQQDDPIIDQYRRTFKSAWQKVNAWIIEAIWLTDAVVLPGYSPSLAVYWAEFRAEFPGKLHINPQDTMAAREKGYMLRTQTPQQSCEEDGKDLDGNLDQWGEAMQKAEAAEKKYGLKPGSLAFLVSGKSISTASGDDLGAPAPTEETQSGETIKGKLKLAGGV